MPSADLLWMAARWRNDSAAWWTPIICVASIASIKLSGFNSNIISAETWNASATLPSGHTACVRLT